MAIAAAPAVYNTQGPTGSGQIFANSALSNNEVQFLYNVTVTLDGATTSFTLNFIDGTKTLSFTPSAVTAQVVGGTQNATSVLSVSTDTPTNTGVVIHLSGAGTTGNTVKIAGFILQ
jgi:hypothetical protein